jgi:hypothetical protein
MRTLSLVAGLMLAGYVLADEKIEGYVKDDKLVKTLTVRDMQGGVVGFTGEEWKIEASGKWTSFKVTGPKTEETGKGELSKEQLKALGTALEKFNLAELPSKGKATVNPHVVTIKFGDKESTLNLMAGEALPKPDATTVEGRYAGIEYVVKELAKEKKRGAER